MIFNWGQPTSYDTVSREIGNFQNTCIRYQNIRTSQVPGYGICENEATQIYQYSPLSQYFSVTWEYCHRPLNRIEVHAQPAIKCSKLTIVTLEVGVKNVQGVNIFHTLF